VQRPRLEQGVSVKSGFRFLGIKIESRVRRNQQFMTAAPMSVKNGGEFFLFVGVTAGKPNRPDGFLL